MTIYREQGRMVDETEIEKTKIREAAETKRLAITEREKARLEGTRLRNEWWRANGPGVLVVSLVFLIALTCVGAIVTPLWIERAFPPVPCVDRRVTEKGDCTHPDHDLVRSSGGDYCLCRLSIRPGKVEGLERKP